MNKSWGNASSENKRLTFAAVLLFAVIPLVPVGPALMGCTSGGVILFVSAWRGRQAQAIIAATLSIVWGLLALAGVPYTQLGLLVGAASVILLVSRTPWMQENIPWLAVGRTDWRTWALGLAAVVSSAAALVGWNKALEPDLTTIYESFGFNYLALPWVAVGALMFAMMNAAVEEVVYRGLLLEAALSCAGRGGALAIQAVAFGVLHFWGFPAGVAGVALATAYGAIMGLVRLRARGMLVPWAVHMVTDLVVIAILMRTVRV